MNATERPVAEALVQALRERWGTRATFVARSSSDPLVIEHLNLLARVLRSSAEEARTFLLAGWVDPFEDGAGYWVTYKDGSRFLMYASVDSEGVVDLSHEDLDLTLWQVNGDGYTDYTFERAES